VYTNPCGHSPQLGNSRIQEGRGRWVQVVGTDRREVPFRLVATNLSMTQCLARLRGIHGQDWGESLRLHWDCPDRGTNAVKMLSPASNPIFLVRVSLGPLTPSLAETTRLLLANQRAFRKSSSEKINLPRGGDGKIVCRPAQVLWLGCRILKQLLGTVDSR
jgi:hypothetical protein